MNKTNRVHVYEATNRRVRDKYHAVAPELPGNPPIGIGRTPLEAIGSLVAALAEDQGRWESQGWPAFDITGVSEIVVSRG